MMGKVIMSGVAPHMKAPFSGIKASELAVGSSVYLMENGVATEYLIVNQGKPSGSSLYDDSCDGMWLLRKDCYEERKWHSSNVNDYENSTIHSYLNSTFLAMFDSNIQKVIKQVKLPYRKGSGYGTTVTSGTSGLAAKIFLLSGYEVAYTRDMGLHLPIDGACLSYFSKNATADSKRVAYLNGKATNWWLRSPYCHSSGGSAYAFYLLTSDGWGSQYCSYSYGIRPALILPKNVLFDKNTLILKGVA